MALHFCYIRDVPQGPGSGRQLIVADASANDSSANAVWLSLCNVILSDDLSTQSGFENDSLLHQECGCSFSEHLPGSHYEEVGGVRDYCNATATCMLLNIYLSPYSQERWKKRCIATDPSCITAYRIAGKFGRFKFGGFV